VPAVDLTAVTKILSPAQLRSIVEARQRINVWEGSVRSGKTIASLLRWLIFVANPPRDGELVMIGKTRETIARNLFGPLQNLNLFGPLARHIQYTPGAPVPTSTRSRSSPARSSTSSSPAAPSPAP
jgi:hypothetical protein